MLLRGGPCPGGCGVTQTFHTVSILSFPGQRQSRPRDDQILWAWLRKPIRLQIYCWVNFTSEHEAGWFRFLRSFVVYLVAASNLASPGPCPCIAS